MTPPGGAVAALAARAPGPFAALCAGVGALAVLAVARDDARLWAFLVVVALGLLAVAAADRVARFSPGLLVALAALGVVHVACGLLPSPTGGPTLYETWLLPDVLKLDQAVHLAGSAVGTVAAWQVLGRLLDHRRTSARVQAQLAAAVGLGKGALNEVVEFVAALGLDGLVVGDGANAGWDLVFDLAGVAAAALWLWLAAAPRSTEVSRSSAAC